jgi:ketosteroid isomerase-like protein
MSSKEIVQEAYRLARKGDHRSVRQLLADDATWYPSREDAWHACRDPDTIVRTLLWRAGMGRLRPADPIELGDRVMIRLKGLRLRRLGGSGGFRPKLFQVVELRNGKIVRMQDYAERGKAMAAVGLEP